MNDEYKELADKIFDIMNASGRDASFTKVLAEKWLTEHRTLQQGFGRMLKTIIETYAVMSVGSDLRNEATLAWAKEVAKLGPSGSFPYI